MTPSRPLRLLVTACCGPSGASVMRLLCGVEDLEVIGIDSSRGDVPHGSSFDYLLRLHPWLFGIDHVLPCSDPEILSIGRMGLFGSRTILPSRETVVLCADKAALYRRVAGAVPIPSYMIGGFVKPRNGSGGKGAYAVPEDHVICESLPGPEYSIDALFWAGRSVSIVRRRDVILRGACRRGCVLSSGHPVADLIRIYVKTLAGLLDLHGPACIQFKTHADGSPRLTDVNLRFGGGVTISAAAGVNLPRLLVDCLHGAPLPESVEPTPGIYATMLAEP